MKRLCLLIFSTCAFYSSYANPELINNTNFTQVALDEVTGVISKNTTEKQFEDLIAYFKEHEIKLDISEVNYNEQDEITGIKILLQKENQKSRYAMSSNVPIADLELGSKNGSLFITTKTNLQSDRISAIMSEFEKANESFDNFLSEHPFSFSFSSDQLRDLLNNAEFNFEEFANGFIHENEEDDKQSNYTKSQKKSRNSLPKYNFINNPNINKLIIIDGKETDFRTLNKLAKSDQLDEVDNLKPATAISIYGKKAKDGAIIATTKK